MYCYEVDYDEELLDITVVSVSEPVNRVPVVLCGQAGLKYLSSRATFKVRFLCSASAISLARLAKGRSGQESCLSTNQGHLWGKALAAGGRRLEDAGDARPAREPGMPRSVYPPVSEMGVIVCSFIAVVTGVSRDLRACVRVLIQTLSSISRQSCATLILELQ